MFCQHQLTCKIYILRYASTVFHKVFCLIFGSTAPSVVAQQHHENVSDLNIKLAYFSRFPSMVSKTVVECKKGIKQQVCCTLLHCPAFSKLLFASCALESTFTLSPKNYKQCRSKIKKTYFPILQDTFVAPFLLTIVTTFAFFVNSLKKGNVFSWSEKYFFFNFDNNFGYSMCILFLQL
jgi:hypothetical protein